MFLTLAHPGVGYVVGRIPVVERFTFAAVSSHSIVLALVTYTTAHAISELIHRRVKMTSVGVVVTFAFCVS